MLKAAIAIMSHTTRRILPYVANTYPLATRETDASRTYNCHSYTWHSQSLPNHVWIDRPEQAKYWTDGSYTFLTNAPGAIPFWVPDGAKVSYASDDHSAIKVSSTHFRSKWGQLPRMYHTPGYSPSTLQASTTTTKEHPTRGRAARLARPLSTLPCANLSVTITGGFP